jgi:DNA-binding CsgD family transcriptional regulator
MYKSPPKSPFFLSLVEAICDGDTSAWCFFPVSIEMPAWCSRPFRSLWNLPPIATDAEPTFQIEGLADAWQITNVSAEAFFERIAGHRIDVPDRLQLFRHGEDTIELTIECVFNKSNGMIFGHLIRCRLLAGASLIDTILRQIMEARRKTESLSNREQEILNLVYEGRTNKAISIVTGISEKTVEKHRARIMLKLGLKSTTMMIRTITLARLLPESTSASEPETSSVKSRNLNRQFPIDTRMKPPAVK